MGSFESPKVPLAHAMLSLICRLSWGKRWTVP